MLTYVGCHPGVALGHFMQFLYDVLRFDEFVTLGKIHAFFSTPSLYLFEPCIKGKRILLWFFRCDELVHVGQHRLDVTDDGHVNFHPF